MPGPTPKHVSKRRRANATAGPLKLPAGKPAKAPTLPIKDVSAATREWWRTVWASPMAHVWLEADVPGLVRLASLVERASGEDAPLTVLTEIRALEDRFGLSPLARRRLEWEIEAVAGASAAANGKGDDARWHRVTSG